MIGHPRFSQLHLYAQGEISERRRRRIRRHLAACAKCRNTLLDLKRITAETKLALSEYEPRNLLQRVLERRAAGERVLLPLSEVSARKQHTNRHVFVYAGVAIAVALLAASFGLGELQADRSELQFDPPNPELGAEIRVSYRAVGPLARADRLVLRARFRSRNGKQYNRAARQIVVTELTKRRGRFRATFTLPDSVVYAVFAVEDATARIVDSNGRALWELLVHVDGKPAHEALVQRQNDLVGRNWELAAATARRATELYPDNPIAWYRLSGFERALSGQNQRDSVIAKHTQRYREVRTVLSAADSLNGDQLAGMFWWARAINDSIEARYWRSRLLSEAPKHWLAVRESFSATIDELRQHPRQLLSVLDWVWAERLLTDEAPVHWALAAAMATDDDDAVIRWATRARTLGFDQRHGIADSLTSVDRVRHVGMSELRYHLQQLPNDSNRALGETAPEFQLRTGELGSALLASLGHALLADHQVAAARDTLWLAAQHGWNIATFFKIARATLSAHDTTTALQMLANIAADPGTPQRQRDSVRSIAEQLATPEHWETLTATAFDDMWDRTVQSAVRLPLPDRVRLTNETSDRHLLRQVIEAELAVVAFWSAACEPALRQLGRLDRVASELEGRGVQVITIIPGAPTNATDAHTTERRPMTPIFYDPWGEAVRAFNSWGTPEYYIVDRRGVIRFARSGLEEVARQVAVLRASYEVTDDRTP